MMNNLSKKYNIPPETLKKMVCDGVITSSWVGWEEIYDYYKSSLTSSGNRTDAVLVTSIEKKVSSRHVYQIIHYIEGGK